MQSRRLWAAVALLVMVAFYFWSRHPLPFPDARARGNLKKANDHGIESPANAVPFVAAPPPVVTVPPIALPPVAMLPPPPRLAPEMVVPIQDRATIDFSIGAPVVRSGGSDSEILERALRQMEEATKDMTFPPSKPAP